MKRKDLRDRYEYHTGKASDVGRQLAFAGIAVVWLFRVGEPTSALFPPELLAPLVFFVLALGLDLAQYVVCSIVWGVYNRYREVRRSHIADDATFEAPVWINAPGLLFFWGKIASVGFAHFLLVKFVSDAWRVFG